MEVSKREARKMDQEGPKENAETASFASTEENTAKLNPDFPLEGEQLIQTVVSLTGLPQGLANDELNEILDMSGHSSNRRSDLTLDDLRAALLTYLEALAPSCSE